MKKDQSQAQDKKEDIDQYSLNPEEDIEEKREKEEEVPIIEEEKPTIEIKKPEPIELTKEEKAKA